METKSARPVPGGPIPRFLSARRRGLSPGARSWRPPPQRPRNPATFPSKGERARARPASSASRAKWRRLSSARSTNGGIVIRPVTGTGQRAMKSPRAFGVDAGLLVLARHVHLDEHLLRRGLLELRQRRLRGERVDQPHVRHHVLDLAALKLADEVPREQVAVGLLLGQQLLRPVLAHQLDARLRQCRQVIGLHVLHRGEHLDLGADLLAHPLEVAPYAFRIHRAR